MFPKFENNQKVTYVQDAFSYLKYDDFLTKFRIIVVLITYVMQDCEFRFTGFTLLYSLCMSCTYDILDCSIFENVFKSNIIKP